MTPSEDPLVRHRTIPVFLVTPALFEFPVIGVEDSLTTRSGGRLFCDHVSSRTNVNLREEVGERWSGAARTEGGGEKTRPRCAPDSSAAPAPLSLAPPSSPFFTAGNESPVLIGLMGLKVGRHLAGTTCARSWIYKRVGLTFCFCGL